ncbi:MAG: GNAT family N-acetyltransferase [Acidimicrobiales bacterium]
MKVESARITLVPMTLLDASAIGSDDRLGRLWAPDFPTDGDVRVASLVEREFISLVTSSWPWGPYVVLKNESGWAIGGIGFKGGPDTDGDVEIGYGISRSCQRKGFATEAVRLMCDIARRHGALSLSAETDLGNRASQRVLQNCGFAREPDHNDLAQWRIPL